MQIKNGLVCRFCGKSWFPHSLHPHEKECRRKALIILEQLKERHQIDRIPHLPEYTDETLPNLTQTAQIRLYNSWALGEFEKCKIPCCYCNRKFPPSAISDHQAECASFSQTASPAKPSRPGTRGASGASTLGSTMGGRKFKGPKYYDGTIESAVGEEKSVPQWMKKEVELRATRAAEIAEEPPIRGVGGRGSAEMSPDLSPTEEAVPALQRTRGGYANIDSFGMNDVPPAGTPFGQSNSMPGRSGPRQSGFKPRPNGSGSGIGGGNDGLLSLEGQDGNGGEDGRVACSHCGRKFAPDRIAKHESICVKLKHGPAAPLKKGESHLASTAHGPPPGSESPAPRSRAAPAPRVPREPIDPRIACRYCGRKFNPDRISKHESICRNVENKPPPPPSMLPKPRVSASPMVSMPPAGRGSSPRRSVSRGNGATARGGAYQSPDPRQIQSGRGIPQPSFAKQSPAGGFGGMGGGSGSGPKFCSNCGAPFGGVAKFCSECGQPRG